MASDSNYEILEEIGKGTLTVVYRAYDRSLRRYVAIKTLQENATDVQRERFLNQARFLAGLKHPNVLNVHAFDASSGWMVMELLSGNLRERIQQGNLSADVCMSILKQSLEALAYLHGLQLVHGSIRPSNILIDESGHVKLSDFPAVGTDGAIAAPEAHLSKYVPPEIWDEARFGPIGQAMDFYALGFSVLECLQGKSLDSLLPRLAENANPEVEWARWHTSPEHSVSVDRLIPKSLGNRAALLRRLLNQKASDRPQAASDVIRDLSGVAFKPVMLETASVPTIAGVKIPDSPFDQVSASGPSNQGTAPFGGTSKHSGSRMPAWIPSKWELSDKIFFRWALGTVMLMTAIIYSTYLMMSTVTERSVVVSIHPNEADVTISNSEGKSKSFQATEGKLTLSLTPGKYNVLATASGHDEVRTEFQLLASDDKSDDKKEIKIDLPLSSLDVAIETNPRDASIYLKDELLHLNNRGVYKLKAGTYELSIRKSDYQSRAESITVSPQSRNKLSVAPLLAIVKIASVPEKVRVFDGTTEQMPLIAGSQEYAMPRGERVLEFQQKGYISAKKKVDIVAGATLSIELLRDNEGIKKEIVRKAPPNEIGLELVWCPPGKFLMGSPPGEGEDNEHGSNGGTVEVSLTKGFWIGKYEVTQSQWKQVMSTSPWSGNTEAKIGDDIAASYVSWKDAVDFCKNLNRSERSRGNISKGQYQIPTEAQWEYACRSGTSTPFSFGDDARALHEYAWFDGNGYNVAAFHAQKVGSMKPNGFGLFDMHGNVWEWCLDAYVKSLRGGENPSNRPDSNSKMFVIRGGSWYGSSDDARSARRGFESIENKPTGAMGFRVVLVEE